jgi:hypothetical protein
VQQPTLQLHQRGVQAGKQFDVAELAIIGELTARRLGARTAQISGP